MELLIPGLILVALMVWASTRIKRQAAEAFEPESIQTEHFSLEKPAGFLHVVNDETDLAFRAYSKEYGSADLKGHRQATIEVEVFQDATLADRIAKYSEPDRKEPYLDAGEAAVTFCGEGGGEDPYTTFYKLVTRGPKIVELRFAVLKGCEDEHEIAKDKVFSSFDAK